MFGPSHPLQGSTAARNARLDAIRGVAVLAVVTAHSFEAPWLRLEGAGLSQSSWLYQLGLLSRYGVELFFALSGWLIFSLYYRREAHGYWPRRLARIWPLWALFAVLSVLAMWGTGWVFIAGQLVNEPSMSPVLALVLALAFLGWLTNLSWNIPPGGWSIQVEMGHYLGFWAWRRRGPWFWLLTIPAGYATFFAARWLTFNIENPLVREAGQAWVRLGVAGTWPFFVAGGLAYLFWHDRGRLASNLHLERWPSRIGLAGLLIGSAALAWWVPVPFGRSPEAALVVLLLIGLTFVCMRSSILSRVLISMGAVSYFVYFAHFWFVTAISAWLVDVIDLIGIPVTTPVLLGTIAITFATAAIGSWALGKASWRFLEQPIIARVRVMTSRSDPVARQP